MEAPVMSNQPERRVYRHRAFTRVWHWLNLICLMVLLASGLQIFNAYPRLHWGQYGANADKAFIEIMPEATADGGARGVTRIGPLKLTTTGVLGLSKGQGGELEGRAFPRWLTVPSYQDLATGRRFHFFFAWSFVLLGAAYVIHSTVSRHLKGELLPTREELAPRRLLAEIKDHARLKVPRGEEALRYNPIQKLAYLAVIFGLLPLMVLTGLTMMPGMDAAWPWLLDLFGGRPSARTIHFISASLIVLFVAVHVFEVILVGPVRAIGSMITGWWTVEAEKPAKDAP
jgi:thiosulfate reductase cytochrome b subunit